MNTLIVWLLIATSNGTYNGGNVVVVARFASENDCRYVAQTMRDHNLKNLQFNVDLNCVQAQVIK